jgi:hypothetical protein
MNIILIYIILAMDSHIFNFLRGNMRSKILVVAVLILLGVAAYSAYSSFNNGNISDDIDIASNDNEGIVQKIEYELIPKL